MSTVQRRPDTPPLPRNPEFRKAFRDPNSSDTASRTQPASSPQPISQTSQPTLPPPPVQLKPVLNDKSGQQADNPVQTTVKNRVAFASNITLHTYAKPSPASSPAGSRSASPIPSAIFSRGSSPTAFWTEPTPLEKKPLNRLRAGTPESACEITRGDLITNVRRPHGSSSDSKASATAISDESAFDLRRRDLVTDHKPSDTSRRADSKSSSDIVASATADSRVSLENLGQRHVDAFTSVLAQTRPKQKNPVRAVLGRIGRFIANAVSVAITGEEAYTGPRSRRIAPSQDY